MEATVLRSSVIQSDPDSNHGCLYRKIEIGAVLVPRLLAANLLLFSVTRAAMRTVPVTGRSIPRRSLKR